MKSLKPLFTCLCALGCLFAAQTNDENFPLAKESMGRIQGVVPGETLSFKWDDSKIFPGTERIVKVYVPAAYDGKTPACVAIFQDGGGFRLETVIDNLIRTNKIPTMIAVIVPSGKVPAARGSEGWRHNRTFEYDTPDGRYGRFLLDEILPAVETLKTSDGRAIVLSKSGNDRMIAGASSGAAAAFNAAWAYPEEFSRVFSAIGSYTGLRGSYIYPTLIHKTEPKALRLFLQSGTRDMWTSFGDWWSANNAMVRALEFAGYDFKHAFGDGKHSQAHGTALFPAVMHYLWEGWPNPVKAGIHSRNHVQSAVLERGKGWEVLSGTFTNASTIFSDKTGEVFFSRNEQIYKRPRAGVADKDGKGTLWGFYTDGESRLVQTDALTLVLRAADGTETVLCERLFIASVAVAPTGEIYAAGSGKFEVPAQIWLLKPGAEQQLVDEGQVPISTIGVSADGNWLAAFQAYSSRGYSFQIQKDGALAYKQTFYVLHRPDDLDTAAPRGTAVCEASAMGYLFVPTNLGVQICDANGRSGAILPLPGNTPAVALCFGGPDFKTLFVLGQDGKIYYRPMKTSGAQPFLPPNPVTQNAG